jgi:hypothetical protein
MAERDSKVVDLNAYKAARASRQLDLLEQDSGGAVKTLEADRSLSDRDVAHRARMLAYLSSAGK